MQLFSLVGLQLELTTAIADCNKDHLYTEYRHRRLYKDNALMIDLRHLGYT